jgi:ferrochelatase
MIVALGMRYGKPAIAEALETLRQRNARRLLVLPLYPQYSATTTGSTFDAVAEVLRGWRWIPEFRFITHYHDHEPYLDALARSIEQSWGQRERGDRLLFSFHGIPQRYFHAGDPYHCQCQATARLVAERLRLEPASWAIAFQSRVGRQKWLQPYTDQLLKRWARDGVRNVDVVCPGFAADCIETLEEIAMQNRMRFLKSGGQALHYIPALNDRSEHIEALAELVRSRAADWCTAIPSDMAGREARAQALGAAR